jgi:hypothetical protein
VSAEHFNHGRCVICGEAVTSDDDPAEMHNPDNPEEEGGICHGECGIAKGWDIS